MFSTGMIKIGAATPTVKVADVEHNKTEIIRMIGEAEKEKAGIIAFPELTVSSYTVGDLMHQHLLYEKQLRALTDIAGATEGLAVACIVGFYLRVRDRLYNCAAFIQNGKVRGVVPKTFTPNTYEFCEIRWFAEGTSMELMPREVLIGGEKVPFGNLLFTDTESDIKLGIEICRDMWCSLNPGTFLALAGAHIIFNISASNETVGKAANRRAVVKEQSRKNFCAYLLTSSGVTESTTDLVFSGHHIIAECGTVLAENERYERTSTVTYSEIDVDKIKFDRGHGFNMPECADAYARGQEPREVVLEPLRTVACEEALSRKYEQNPLLPKDAQAAYECCKDIFSIQSAALAKRMEHVGVGKTLLGISGGLDSTLALMVAAEAHRLLGLPASNIITVTMPGFGTTDHTHDNAVSMMKLLGTDMREISIKEAVLQHFGDIGHDKDVHDLTYENAQARERTQILMDMAGKEGALMVGTGDLSEIALGWCTYNGDHMAMYGVNGGVTKTMIPHVLDYVMKTRYQDKPELQKTIQSVIDTPISPELLPPTEGGDIAQKTEDKVGPYALHDFFIYHTLAAGMRPAKLFWLAKQAFAGVYTDEVIKKWLRTFYQRFFSQQFKRNCAPDCPKAMVISLSSKGDWHMPSDACSALWTEEVDRL